MSLMGKIAVTVKPGKTCLYMFKCYLNNFNASKINGKFELISSSITVPVQKGGNNKKAEGLPK